MLRPTKEIALEIFEDQVISRLLDATSRELKKRNESFYTIGSAGHENNAVIGTLLRLDDPCFLHYRSGGLMMARSRKYGIVDPILDTLLSFCASADDPISQGRHKVWGSHPMWVPPQTSTIASHLPKATGLAFAMRQAIKAGVAQRLPYALKNDSIVLCSFGDASANHATALTGINAARYTLRRSGACPVIFVCEDNGIGISVKTPDNWIKDSFSNLPYLKYFGIENAPIDQVWETASEAIDYCRKKRAPVFLHMQSVRLWGHAGTDIETTYRTPDEIAFSEANDPLLINSQWLIESSYATSNQIQNIKDKIQKRIEDCVADVTKRPKLKSVAQIIEPLAPYNEVAIRNAASINIDKTERANLFDGALPEQTTTPTKRTMAAHINSALADEMLRRQEIILFGEDVGKKGGVYFVTQGLQKKFGQSRVFDTMLDETTILGTAQGAATAGLLPIPEIQYLAYIHNALDQLRGEACSLSFFSSGQFTNPMVVRVAGLAYQKGFGGHFHNDNSIGALRDIPGLVLCVPSRGDDAAKMLRGCIATAKACGRVIFFLEPIALYHEKDLYEDGDSKWLSNYPPPNEIILPGEVGTYNHEAKDLLIISYANGLRLSLRAAKTLKEQHGINSRVIDLRWLNPLPVEAIKNTASEFNKVLVVDECRSTGGGIADAVIAMLEESGFSGTLRSVRAVDTYVPLGAAADLVLVSQNDIVEAVRGMF